MLMKSPGAIAQVADNAARHRSLNLKPQCLLLSMAPLPPRPLAAVMDQGVAGWQRARHLLNSGVCVLTRRCHAVTAIGSVAQGALLRRRDVALWASVADLPDGARGGVGGSNGAGPGALAGDDWGRPALLIDQRSTAITSICDTSARSMIG
jgi:hypothetical protein